MTRINGFIESSQRSLTVEQQMKHGDLFLEGRVTLGKHCKNKNVLQKNLEIALSGLTCSFDFEANILADARAAEEDLLFLLLVKPYGSCILECLKIVEFRSQEKKATRFCMSEWNLRVNLYELYDDEKPSADDAMHAEVISMPNQKFKGIWERLSFQDDWKSTMTTLSTNILLRTQSQTSRRCPLILFHGPAGSGKTTFAQGLAQKLSIRVSDHYLITKLYEVRTATLLSRFHGQSSKEVEEVFFRIRQASEDDEKALIIVLMDEVESIAGSRQTIIDQGEAQDALRATNALLTNLDKLKLRPNVFVMCTTNYPGHLDAAFVDRCIAKKEIKSPGRKAQYEILSSAIHDLIENGDILCETTTFPRFAEAKRSYRAKEYDAPAYKLFGLLERVRAMHPTGKYQAEISGRYISGLPANALDMLRHQVDRPSLDKAFSFFEQYASMERGESGKDSDSDSGENAHGEIERDRQDMHMSDEQSLQSLGNSGDKRKFSIHFEVEGDGQLMSEVVDLLKKRAKVVMKLGGGD